MENIQRKDLDAIEEAMAIDSLMKEFGYTQQELSERLGMSRSALANSVRLLSLPEQIKSMIISGTLSSGHARCLISLDDADKLEIAQMIAQKQLNVRQSEQLVKQITEKKNKTQKKKKTYVELTEVERSLREFFGTKVNINGTPKKGKLIIEYYSQDELEGILDLFMEK